jgi:hypothetical protein
MLDVLFDRKSNNHLEVDQELLRKFNGLRASELITPKDCPSVIENAQSKLFLADNLAQQHCFAPCIPPIWVGFRMKWG